MTHHPPDQPKPIRPQVHYSTSFDTALPEWQQPVTYSEASNGVAAFCHVWITKDLHVSVGTAAEAQEFETRFAAARMYLTDGPVPTPVTDGEVACGVRDDMHYHCTLPIGHAGDHIAHGDRRVRGQLEHYVISAWPQPFDEFHEYPPPPGDLDDAGDDITDALVAHSEVAHELGECDCPDTAQPGLDVTHSTNTRGRQMRRADGSSAPMWFGYCSCGWEGPSRISRTSAIKDANEHPADDPRIVVPDVAQPADLDAWKANVQQHVECTVGARPGFARNPTTFRFEPTVVTP